MNNAHHNPAPHTNNIPMTAPVRVVERKIGNATFIVSSRFAEGREKDIVSTIARLVQQDSGRSE